MRHTGGVKKWNVIILLAAAQFVMVLDTTVMNVSISNVVDDLDSSLTQVQMAITLYTLVMGAFMLLGGKLGDILGRKRALSIGLLIYGAGSMTTALSPSIGWLYFGWSFVEGFGAVMVIPAIVSLTASNYHGADRAMAYGVLGGIAAAGAAAGPLIGGWVTDAWTWRVVFAAETFVCVVIVLLQRSIADAPREGERPRIDWVGVALSAVGMGLIVLAILNAGTWGFVKPRGALTIGGNEITPLGLSVVPFMILAGLLVLAVFGLWERRIHRAGGAPLLRPGMLRVFQLRIGLSMLVAQQMVVAGMIFMLPVYLQYVLGQDALETGITILPLSIAMLLAAFAGPKLGERLSPRRIVYGGLSLIVVGSVVMVAAIEPDMTGPGFSTGLALFGAGVGLLASQTGNVIMSSVGDRDRGEAGGLQGTAQNIGASIGVALLGAVLVAALSGGVNKRISDDPTISPTVQTGVQQATETGAQVLPAYELEKIVDESAIPDDQEQQVIDHYQSAQLDAIRLAMLFAGVLGLLGFLAARKLPTIRASELAGASVEAPPA
ncbi:MAG: MFS transporter [Actinobacteria bacterium]|nr:MFS transporter [Actinomycetota bacterium]